MFQPILYLVHKEFRQIFRDRAMVRIIFIVPLIQLLVLSYAATQDLRNVRLAVLDHDNTPQSRALVNAFFNTSTDLFIPAEEVTSPDQLEPLLARGKADITLWIERGYAEKLATGSSASVSIAVNGQNSSLAGRAGGYANAIVRREAQKVMEERMLARPELRQRSRRVEAVTRFFYNPQLESRYYMVPGIIVLVVTIISGMLTGMAIVREKEIGTLEQLMVTPITPLQLVAGKTIPFAILSFIEMGFVTVVAVLWFRLPLTGPIWLLAASALIYLLVTLGGGLLASTVSSTQQQAMFSVWFALVFGILMSGFFFPIENMPKTVQPLTYLNPMRYFISIVRGIFLKGSTFVDVLPDLATLFALGVVVFTTAVLRFRKRLA